LKVRLASVALAKLVVTRRRAGVVAQ
jgi:hypothetical protein